MGIFSGYIRGIPMKMSDAEAEAIRVFYCLSTQESIVSTAREFGRSRGTITSIVDGKTHVGKPRGNMKGKRPEQLSVVGREKRAAIWEMLKDGPKDVNEIRAAIGSDPGKYLTEMRKLGKIDRRFVWCRR